MLELIEKTQKILGKDFEKEFEAWKRENCPQVIGGNGIGDCNCCPYPVCIEFFKKILENKKEV